MINEVMVLVEHFKDTIGMHMHLIIADFPSQLLCVPSLHHFAPLCSLYECLGTDLATPSKYNLLWHTGLPRNIYTATSIKDAQPWQYVRRVAEATSVGEGMANPEAWDAWARRQVGEHMFFQ